MKIVLPVLVFIVSLLTISFSNKKIKKEMAGNQDGFALVELFTSEGCSSCPPAEALVEELQNKYDNENLLVLGYHVDYWDKLGWKDPYSSPEFTSRQQYYAGVFDLNTIYTPQVVVNGEKEFVGSDRKKLQAAIKKGEEQTRSLKINLEARTSADNSILVNHAIDGKINPGEQLVLLLVQKMAINEIKRGENKGRTLHHINIVRKYFTVESNRQKQTSLISLPDGLNKDNCFLAAFVQDNKSGKISGIQSAEIR